MNQKYVTCTNEITEIEKISYEIERKNWPHPQNDLISTIQFCYALWQMVDCPKED